MGDLEGILVRNCYGEVLGWSDRGLVRRSEKWCCSVKRTGPESEHLQIGDLVVLVDDEILRDVGTKVSGSW